MISLDFWVSPRCLECLTTTFRKCLLVPYSIDLITFEDGIDKEFRNVVVSQPTPHTKEYHSDRVESSKTRKSFVYILPVSLIYVSNCLLFTLLSSICLSIFFSSCFLPLLCLNLLLFLYFFLIRQVFFESLSCFSRLRDFHITSVSSES